jgi:hypothetical protein
MSREPIEEALEIISTHSDRSDFVGPQTEELIAKAEACLGIAFPPSYRTFLSTLGAGNFGAEEVYGLVGSDDFEHSSVPDAIWMTLEARQEWTLNSALVVVYFDGSVRYFAIDTSRVGARGEPPIVALVPSAVSGGGSHSSGLVCDDFGTLLLDLVRQELEMDDD